MARKGGIDRGIRQRKGRDGWWVRLYTNGREQEFRCDTKSQAKALYGRLKAQQREGKYFEKTRLIPFREIAEEYVRITDARRHRKGDDRARMNRWVCAFGNQDAGSITGRQIEKVLGELQAEGKEPATLIRYLTVLKATFNRAKRLGLLKDNPTSLVKTPKPNNVLVRYLTPEQETLLLQDLPAQYHAIVTVALNTGLRQGELLRVSWADVDWNVGVLTIHETKAGERRRVPMNSTVVNLLTMQYEELQPSPAARVFTHDGRYLRRAFARAVKAAGLAPFRFHDLRHTFASRLAMDGANDRTLMALGGWKSPAMLSRYAHLSPAHLWKAVEGLTRIGTGTKTGTDEGQASKSVIEPVEKVGAGKGI